MKRLKAFKWLSGGVDAVLALTYWGFVFHSSVFYAPYEYRLPLVYGAVLIPLIGVKIWVAKQWLERDWAKRHPFIVSIMNVFFSGYVIFLALILAYIFVPGSGGAIYNYAYLPLVPLVFFLYGFPVVLPIWVTFSLAQGCCLYRAGRAI